MSGLLYMVGGVRGGAVRYSPLICPMQTIASTIYIPFCSVLPIFVAKWNNRVTKLIKSYLSMLRYYYNMCDWTSKFAFKSEYVLSADNLFGPQTNSKPHDKQTEKFNEWKAYAYGVALRFAAVRARHGGL